ncbi:YhjD/YihY/BrkB family envelope integrity protein [Kitasatospora sp. NPDC059673]|uniref:YhjD/YihY/BrkB family envelope integrity protein n=1 Tax=Kitasatospora sp. NPDC059673 TaxID=3346901 RepID=UPI00368360F5
MRTHNAPGKSPDGCAARTRAAPESGQPSGRAAGRASVRRARRTAEWGRAKYVGSWAENLWQRLNAVDFLNQALQLAATLLLCAVPFLLIVSALAGRVAGRRLLPGAVATGLFWIGMLIVFRFTFSGMIVSDDTKYGPIGVVFSLMAFFIATGVVIILGAATGMMGDERGMSWRAAISRMRRAS